MPIFQGTSSQQIKEGYLQIIRHTATFFSVHLTTQLKLWQNMFGLFSGDNNKNDWKPVLLIVELFMCAPQSNAALEKFFSQLNYVKTNTRASLEVRHYKSIIMNMWRLLSFGTAQKSDARRIKRNSKNISNVPVLFLI